MQYHIELGHSSKQESPQSARQHKHGLQLFQHFAGQYLPVWMDFFQEPLEAGSVHCPLIDMTWLALLRGVGSVLTASVVSSFPIGYATASGLRCPLSTDFLMESKQCSAANFAQQKCQGQSGW
eukprot:scaffold12498_cov14-Tisochrysis_lutea.AAC.1